MRRGEVEASQPVRLAKDRLTVLDNKDGTAWCACSYASVGDDGIDARGEVMTADMGHGYFAFVPPVLVIDSRVGALEPLTIGGQRQLGRAFGLVSPPRFFEGEFENAGRWMESTRHNTSQAVPDGPAPEFWSHKRCAQASRCRIRRLLAVTSKHAAHRQRDRRQRKTGGSRRCSLARIGKRFWALARRRSRLTFRYEILLEKARRTRQNAHHCPHGRPTTFRLSRHELDRKFRRL
jgi:hypothetical protein